MQTLFEDEWVEAVVGLCAAGRFAGATPEDVRRYHVDRERCYAEPDPDRRAAAFVRVHLDWFARWGLRQRLDDALARFPALAETLEAMVFRQARGGHDEGAELYRDPGGRRRGVIALRPDRMVTEPVLVGFLNHELAHLTDMVSPAYGYSASLRTPGQTASQERLVRDRYRLLWNIRVDGALHRRSLPGLAGPEARRAEFERAFRFLPDPRREALFGSLWSGALATHAELLAVAADPRELRSAREPVPGAPCPLCGFAAFRWARADDLRPEARARVREDFPRWDLQEPLCARCAEIYDAVSGAEYPSTVCLTRTSAADP